MRYLFCLSLLLTIATPVPADQTRLAVEGLPPEAPSNGTFITVDVSRNKAYFWRDGLLLASAPVATGMDKLLKKGDRAWLFRTPRGRHQVVRKVVDPVWRKPDWAFVEEGKRVPPADSPLRLERGKLGKYALDLGDGIMIHGTKETRSFGTKASHGCIRMPAAMLERVYREAEVGMDVYIFDSEPVAPLSAHGLNDLDFAVGR